MTKYLDKSFSLSMNGSENWPWAEQPEFAKAIDILSSNPHAELEGYLEKIEAAQHREQV